MVLFNLKKTFFENYFTFSTNETVNFKEIEKKVRAQLNKIKQSINDIPEDTDTSDEASDSDAGGVVDESGTLIGEILPETVAKQLADELLEA